MHHLQVKKYAKQYADEFKEIGESALKLKLSDEGMEDTDIEDIIDKIKETDEPKEAKEPKKAPKVDLKGNANSEFEEWKVDLRDKDAKENKDEAFDKVRKLKTVRIPEDMAARLNEQSAESKIRYYAI